MSDIFDEVSAELRRDNLQAAWDKYGRYLIGGAIALVLLVAAFIGTQALIEGRNEAASQRYDDMLDTLVENEAMPNVDKLLAFAAAEDNGYGALARFSAALTQSREGAHEAALKGFDIIAETRGLPDSLRDLAALQAAIVLLDSGGALSAIEARLVDLLDSDNGLQPMARETMALAYMANDKPLDARDLFREQLADPAVTSLTRERASIMLQAVSGALTGTGVKTQAEQPAPKADE